MKGELMIENNIFSAVNMMISTMRMHKKLLDSSVCKSIGLHRTQHRILMHLARRERLPSQKALAEHINITPAAVTGTNKTFPGLSITKPPLVFKILPIFFFPPFNFYIK